MMMAAVMIAAAEINPMVPVVPKPNNPPRGATAPASRPWQMSKGEVPEVRSTFPPGVPPGPHGPVPPAVADGQGGSSRSAPDVSARAGHGAVLVLTGGNVERTSGTS